MGSSQGVTEFRFRDRVEVELIEGESSAFSLLSTGEDEAMSPATRESHQARCPH